jgi:hypothetical protein
MIGAATPMVAAVGITAMTRLPVEAIATDQTMADLRPRRSAIQPSRKPPNGRATKPAANTASVLRNAAPGVPEKNWDAKNAENVA